MPSYKLHILFAIIFSSIITYILYKYNIYNLTTKELIIIAPILFIYSILPDIDISSSKISKIFRIISLLIIIITLYLNIITLAIIITIILLILEFIKHRKFIHTITAAIILSLPLLYFNYVITIAAFIAYLSHLLLDRHVKLI